MTKKIKVTQIKSSIGHVKSIKGTLLGLGLRKINDSKVLNDTSCTRGMVNKVKHLIIFEEA